MIIDLLSLVGLLGLSAFFSGSETAIFGLQEMELEELEAQGGRSGLAVRLARRPYRTLVTLLLSNMVVNVAMVTFSTALIVDAMGPAGLGVAIPVVTILLLLFGEILPKTLGLRSRRRLAPLAAPIIDVLARVLAPLRVVLEFVASRLSGPTRRLRLRRDELGTLMDVAQEEGVFTRFETRMLSRVLRLADTPVERLLRPRVDVVGIPLESSLEDAVKLFESSGLSRLPVYQESLDRVVGVLYLKDLIHVIDRDELPRIDSLIREPFFVPESKPADELFAEFQKRHVHFAVVVDEHGGMEGVITMEDLLEELIGEVHDESDILADRLEILAPSVWRVDSGIELEELGEALDCRVGEGMDAVTLAGLLEEELGKVPQAGDRVLRDGLELRVLTARPNRPLLVRVTQLAEGNS